MKRTTKSAFGGLGSMVVFVGLATACASSPAKPFDTLKGSNITAFRLQNYEPPPQAQAPAPAAPGAAPVIPGLPPEITQWAQQALPGLQAIIPPGILPPGMVPGAPAAAPPPPPPPPPQPDAPRFAGFRILGQTQIIDPEVKEELGEVLGDEDNYQYDRQDCMYPEMGLRFASEMGGPPNDLLISFSCNRVAAVTFQWPHKMDGMSSDMQKQLAELVGKIWPAGSGGGAPMGGQPSGMQGQGSFNMGTGQ